MRVVLANPRGFCAGVSRAIDIVRLCIEAYGAPVYVRHEIVHNRHVVEDLQRQGAVFVDENSEVPPGQVVIFSAHGVAPTVWQDARERGLKIVDATCPLVTKVHLEARAYARKGYSIVLIGHKGHPEVEGTMGEAPDNAVLVENVEDVERLQLPDPSKVVYLTQTTLSVDDSRAIIEALKVRFPKIQHPPKEDICYATTNRQMAVKELARVSDVVLVIGATNSSNANRLVEVSKECGTRAYLIASAADIQPEWLAGLQTIGVTASASTPEVLVQEVLQYLNGDVEDLTVVDETVQFSLPRRFVQDVRAHGASEDILKHYTRTRPPVSTHA